MQVMRDEKTVAKQAHRSAPMNIEIKYRGFRQLDAGSVREAIR